MKRPAIAMGVGLALIVIWSVASAQAQTVFNVPFEFQAAGQKLPKGEYTVAPRGDGQVILRQESTGKEVLVPVLRKLAQPSPPVAEPRLVFNEVGNFEPSYTEYFTVYILAEVWIAGQDGLEVHVTKGAHKTRIVKVESAKK